MRSHIAGAVGLWFTLVSGAEAHVPYIEWTDFTVARPFVVKKPTQSKVIYSWLSTGSDVDVYSVQIDKETRLTAEMIVPVCPTYAEFRPSFAIVGPGLPAPQQAIPFTIHPGYGATVVSNGTTGEPRNTFFEPFGGKFYYDGPTFDEVLTQPGTWYVVAWDPAGTGGDYSAVIGYEENFTLVDILRSLINTALVRLNFELHTSCPACETCQSGGQ